MLKIDEKALQAQEYNRIILKHFVKCHSEVLFEINRKV
jgi:hypothetical protein